MAETEELDESCEFCWDEEQKEVPATSMQAGVPLCKKHANPKQTRFREGGEPDDELEAMAIPPKPEPRLKRTETIILPKHEEKPKAMTTIEKPHSAELFKPGGSESEFANGLGSLMRDVIEGRVDVDVADAACKVADKIIRVMELRLKMQR